MRQRGRARGQPKAEWKEIAESYPCTTCGAGPGEPCVTSNLNVMRDCHVSRTRLASEHGWHYPEEQS